MLAFSAGTPISISRFDCSTLVTWSVIIFAVLFRFVCDYENQLFANWQLRSVRRESNCRDQRIPQGDQRPYRPDHRQGVVHPPPTGSTRYPCPPTCSSGSGCAVMLCVGSNTASITFMSTEPWISFTYPSAGLASGYVRCGSFISFKISSRMGGELSLIRGNNLPLKAFDVKFFMDTFRKNKL